MVHLKNSDTALRMV